MTAFHYNFSVAVIYAGGTFGSTHGGRPLFDTGDAALPLSPANGDDVLDYLKVCSVNLKVSSRCNREILLIAFPFFEDGHGY